MNPTTSEWFASLAPKERKGLVCLLFGIRGELELRPRYPLFLEFIRVLDNEYHSLK